MSKKRKRHNPEEVVRKLRDADAMLSAGKDVAAVLQTLEISEATLNRWRSQYGGMKRAEAKRPKQLETENARLTIGGRPRGRREDSKPRSAATRLIHG